jgi:FkbM family methyltransferase
MSVVDGLKSLVLRSLPDSLLQRMKKQRYLRTLRSFDPAEEPDMAIVEHLVRAGERAIDLGANVGVYTHFLSRRVGPEGRVLAVEPMPSTFAILRFGVERLGLKNVTLRNCAASDRAGSVTMQVPHYTSGGENYYQAQIVDGGAAGATAGLRQETVETRTLDSLAEELGGELSFVKCDVEGHELQALSGAEAVVRSGRAAWLIEISDDPDSPDSSAHTLFDRLATAGYRPHWFDGNALHPRRPGDTSINFYFLTEAHVAALRERGVSIAQAA